MYYSAPEDAELAGTIRLRSESQEMRLEAGVRRRQQRDREAEALLARPRELRRCARAILRPSTPSPRRSERRTAWRSRSPPTARCWNSIRTSRRPTPRWGSRCTGCSATRAGLESMQRALELDPELPVAASLHLFMGHAWAELEGAAAAAEQYERALRIEPRNQEALDHLAPARFGQRPYEDALALYRTLLEINPDHALTHSNVGAALLHLARPQEALQSIERALALAPDLESPASASPRCASSLTSRDSNRRARGGTAHCRSPAAEPAAPWTAASAARRRDEPALC